MCLAIFIVVDGLHEVGTEYIISCPARFSVTVTVTVVHRALP